MGMIARRAHSPKSNLDYWTPKLARNRDRDEKNQKALEFAGWKVFVVWECEVGSDEILGKRIRAFLGANAASRRDGTMKTAAPTPYNNRAAQTGNSSAGLVLNFSPLEFEDKEITVEVFPYGSDGDEKLKNLRLQHWATHVFRRDGANEIVAVLSLPALPSSARRRAKSASKITLG